MAAFAEGRLTGLGRQRVIEHVASCEDCYEIFAETVRLLYEEELQQEDHETDAGALVVVHPRARQWWNDLRGVVSVAAVLLVAVVGILAGRWLLTPKADLPVAGLTRTLPRGEVLQAHLGEGWEVPGWAGTRGEGFPTLGRQTAFRLGARAVDLQVALQAGDRQRADSLARALIGLLGGVEGAEAVVVVYQDSVLEALSTGEPPISLADTAAAAESLLSSLFSRDPWPYRLGKWAEAGRLAARAGNREYLESRQARSFLSQLPASELPTPIRESLEPIGARLREDLGKEDLAHLRDSFTELVSVGGSGE